MGIFAYSHWLASTDDSYSLPLLWNKNKASTTEDDEEYLTVWAIGD